MTYAAPELANEPDVPLAEEPEAKRPVVIIADDDAALVQMLTIRMKQLGLAVFRSPDAMHALLGAHRIRPALMIVDIHMPGGNGVSVCEMIYSDDSLAGIGMIVMSGDAGEAVARHCAAMGADYVRKGPQLWEELQQAICRRLQLPQPAAIARESPTMQHEPTDNEPTENAPPATKLDAAVARKPQPAAAAPSPAAERPAVLTIDDDPDVTHMIKLRLERLGLEVIEAGTGMQGFWKAVERRPRVIICDLNMPDGEGSYIYGRLTSHPITKSIPVIILTGLSNPALRRHLLGLGVAAYLQKPIVLEELLGELRKHVPLPQSPSPVRTEALTT